MREVSNLRRRALDNLIRPTRAEISESALQHNFGEAKRLAQGAKILCVIKANAYGHGAVHVARVLENAGADFLGVALVEEGIELRNAGIKAPILLLGGTYENGYGVMVEYRLTPTLFRVDQIEAFAAAAKNSTVDVHIKVDTGMGRIGALVSELPTLLLTIKKYPNLRFDGFCTQCANADSENNEATVRQLRAFESLLFEVEKMGFAPTFIHVANTAFSIAARQSDAKTRLNMIRFGVLCYGYAPAEWLANRVSLKPAMTLKSGISHLKQVPAGTPISYGSTHVTHSTAFIATIPIGYADGYRRAFSNRADVIIRGERARVIGRVTMDMCMVDVTHIENVALHDEVTLLGESMGQRVTAEELANIDDTIHYEVLCDVGARVPRLLVK